MFKFLFLIKKLIYAKKIFSLPYKAKILFYGHPLNKNIFKYIGGSKYQIMDVRGLEVNIPLLIISIFSKNIVKSYKENYITYVNPNLIISSIDNDFFLLDLKRKFLNIRLLIIQNGWKAYYGDIFESLDKNHNPLDKFKIDYFFTYGVYVGNYLKKYINGKIISIGSFINNDIDKQIPISQKNNILYISQWQEEGMYLNSQYFTQKEIIRDIDVIILKFLIKYTAVHNLRLNILLRSKKNNKSLQKEINYFKSINSKLNFLISDSLYTSYQLTDQALIVVGSDSSLVYESLARGNKTAFFSIRGKLLKIDGLDFAWPANIKKTGYFWTNNINDRSFSKILDFLINLDDNKWDNYLDSIRVNNIINIDWKNLQIKSIVEKLIV